MTKILLMRHAKAVKPASGMADFDRPLEQSGRADAAKMGRRLTERSEMPDHVICSGAKRTRETLGELNVPSDRVAFSDPLFDFDGTEYVAALRGAEGDVVMIVGHNPSVHDAALMLAGSGEPALREALARKFSPGSVAVLSTDVPLTALRQGCCTLDAFLTPSDPD